MKILAETTQGDVTCVWQFFVGVVFVLENFDVSEVYFVWLVFVAHTLPVNLKLFLFGNLTLVACFG